MKKIGFILIVLIMIISLVSCGAPAKTDLSTVEDYLDLGQKYLLDGDYEQAIVAFEKVIEIEPKNVDAYLGLADVYIAQGDYESAISVLEQGYAETNSAALSDKINELRSIIASSTAVPEVTTTPETTTLPETTAYVMSHEEVQKHIDNGMSYLFNEDYEHVIEELQMVLDFDPYNEDVYVALAYALLVVGDYDEASTIILRGVEQCGNSTSLKKANDSLDFVLSGETGIVIYTAYFNSDMYASGRDTEFILPILYRCADDNSCILMTGANISEPDSFSMSRQDLSISGFGNMMIHLSYEPIQWADSPFGIYMNISEKNHASSWTPFAYDIIYIDEFGKIV